MVAASLSETKLATAIVQKTWVISLESPFSVPKVSEKPVKNGDLIKNMTWKLSLTDTALTSQLERAEDKITKSTGLFFVKCTNT